MPARQRPHHHHCSDCGAKTECPGTWIENFDGIPEVVCPEYHLGGGLLNSDFTCDGCQEDRDMALIRDAGVDITDVKL